LINVARYVERNAVRAHLAERAELWPWSSVGQGLLQEELRLPLAPWPMKRRADYPDRLNEPQNPAEEAAIQLSIRTGRPYGGERWFKRWIEPLGWREPARPGRRAKALV
jgi:hypothetical protein